MSQQLWKILFVFGNNGTLYSLYEQQMCHCFFCFNISRDFYLPLKSQPSLHVAYTVASICTALYKFFNFRHKRLLYVCSDADLFSNTTVIYLSFPHTHKKKTK